MESKFKEIHPALFLVFAEFLGYVSPVIDWAEDICDLKTVDESKREFIKMEAFIIFKKMQEENTLEEIRKWYDEFYPIILQDYDEKLKTELPF